MSKPQTLAKLEIKNILFEAVLKGTNLINDPVFLQQLKPYYDVNLPKASYPPAVWNTFTEQLHQYCYPNLAFEQAAFEIGRQSFLGFKNGTILGRVGLAALKIMSTERSLKISVRLWEEVAGGSCQTQLLGENQLSFQHRNCPIKPMGVIGNTCAGIEYQKSKSIRYSLKEWPSTQAYCYNFDVTYNWD